MCRLLRWFIQLQQAVCPCCFANPSRCKSGGKTGIRFAYLELINSLNTRNIRGFFSAEIDSLFRLLFRCVVGLGLYRFIDQGSVILRHEKSLVVRHQRLKEAFDLFYFVL